MVVGTRGRLAAPQAPLTGLDRALAGVKRHTSGRREAQDPCRTWCVSTVLGWLDTISRSHTEAIDNTDYSCHAVQRRGRIALPGNAQAGAVRSHNGERPSGPGQDDGRRRSDRRVGWVKVYPGSV